jgi:hypothetical protein
MDQATAPPQQVQPQILCEKCRAGYMYSAKVNRFSDGLRVIGFTLWIPSLLIMLGATAFYLMAIASTSTATVAGAASEIRPLDDRLEHVAGLSESFIDRAKDGVIEDADWNLVADDAKERTRAIVAEYEADKAARAVMAAGGAAGTAAAIGVGGCGLVLTYLILVPLFIVGLVLLMKKSVWCCANCRYIYDRA